METGFIEKKKEITVNDYLSEKLFKVLTSGGIVNQHDYDKKTGALVNNPLYTELVNCELEYIKHYRMMGFELVNAGDFFHILDRDVNVDDKQSSKTKIYGAIILLVRYVTQDKRYLYEILTDINYGVSVEDLSGMMENEKYRHILLSSKLESVDGLLKALLGRNIICQMNNDKFILTDAGQKVVEDIIAQNTMSVGDDVAIHEE
jgi:hypothetical protein